MSAQMAENMPSSDGESTTRRRMGRPRIYRENRLSTTLILSESVMKALNAVTTNKSAYIERVLRERPEITERLTHASTQSEEHDDDGD